MGLFVGVPCPEMIKKHSEYIQGALWVLAVRLSLGSRKVDLGRSKEQRHISSRTLLVKIFFLSAETQPTKCHTPSLLLLSYPSLLLCFSFPCEPSSRSIQLHRNSTTWGQYLCATSCRGGYSHNTIQGYFPYLKKTNKKTWGCLGCMARINCISVYFNAENWFDIQGNLVMSGTNKTCKSMYHCIYVYIYFFVVEINLLQQNDRFLKFFFILWNCLYLLCI